MPKLDHFIQHYQTAILLALAVLFLTMRLPQLTLLPPYVDEGLHISRAFNVLDEGQPFVYTEGGKYLQIWLITPMVALGSDPLWNARVVSVLLGLVSAVGCYFLGKALFDRPSVGLAAALFYGIIPYAFFLDRLALNDSMLGTLAIGIALLSLRLIKRQTLAAGLLLGLMLGLTGLTKLNGLILWVIPPLAILFCGDDSFRRLVSNDSLVKWGRLIIVAYGLGVLLIIPIFFAPTAHLDGPASKTWLLDAAPLGSFAEMVTGNLQRVWAYYTIYLTWPILIMALLGTTLTLVRRHRGGLLLLSAILIYNVVFIIITVYLQSRYLFAVVPFALILAGYGFVMLIDGLATLFQRTTHYALRTTHYVSLYLLLLILCSLPALTFNLRLLTNPTQAPFEAYDRWFFLDGWTSGYGLNELAAYLREQADQHGSIVVVRNDASGLTREGLNIKLANMSDTIDLETIDLRAESAHRLTDLLESADGPVYVVLSLPLAPGAVPFNVDFDNTPYCHSAATFYKPDQYNYIGVYRCGIADLVDDSHG
ncbi:MAG: glycosyltransferase family 39 protein [Anaerolineae bacterium]|nr:glycosyltransferase family 39 protein [Anaerolineae bacterium]MCB9079073.1 glycosyltransferase family 39 protein [Anaerolineaceae bacterium]MCB9105377.1 glycosyltransferase family 39 protein [Anaerolineales bacterium]